MEIYIVGANNTINIETTKKREERETRRKRIDIEDYAVEEDE